MCTDVLTGHWYGMYRHMVWYVLFIPVPCWIGTYHPCQVLCHSTAMLRTSPMNMPLLSAKVNTYNSCYCRYLVGSQTAHQRWRATFGLVVWFYLFICQCHRLHGKKSVSYSFMIHLFSHFTSAFSVLKIKLVCSLMMIFFSVSLH